MGCVFCFFYPPAESRKRDSVLAGKSSTGESATPELIHHLQPLLSKGTPGLIGNAFGFHAPSLADPNGGGNMCPGYLLRIDHW